MVKWDYKKKEKGVPHMLGYSKVWYGIKIYYILHTLYTNFKFSIDLPYNSTNYLPANKPN